MARSWCNICGLSDCDSLLPKDHEDYQECQEKNYQGPRCSDCGMKGETAGHQECQYPQDH